MTIRPVTDSKCRAKIQLTPAGLPRYCERPATMTIDGKPVCDGCATPLLATECGRPVNIRRG